MGSALQELSRATKQLPDDMSAASKLVADVYALSVDGFTDAHFERLEEVIVTAIQMLARSPEAEAVELIDKLAIALEGVQEGLPPDPAKRPTREELASQFAKDLAGER
jgi:hypothetical protein